MKDVEWEELKWEEFKWENWRSITIIRVTSEEYLEDVEGNFYYRANLDKHLVKIELPKWAEFDSILWYGIYCKTQANLDWAELLTQEWKLVSVQEETYRDYYRLIDWNQECRINWKKYDVMQAWDQRNNRLVSFIKTWKEYTLFKIRDHTIFMNPNRSIFVLYRWTYYNPETRIAAEDMNNLVVADIWSIESQDIGIVKKTWNNNDKEFGTIFSLKDWKEYICALYKIGSKIVAIKLVDFGYEAQINSSWTITIWWVPCNKELIDSLYKELEPKTEPKVGKLTKKVAEQAWKIITKK